MGGNRKQLSETLDNLPYGSHLCCVYDTPGHQFSALIPFLREGLQRGDKCLYILDESTREELSSVLTEAGIPLMDVVGSGAFLMETSDRTYYRNGSFDTDRMFEYLSRIYDAALAAGFKGMRASGEMTWILKKQPGWEKHLEYEAKLNLRLPSMRAIGICQYNRAKFSTDALLNILSTHPLVLLNGLVFRNPHYVEPAEFLARKRLKGPANLDAYLESVMSGVQHA